MLVWQLCFEISKSSFGLRKDEDHDGWQEVINDDEVSVKILRSSELLSLVPWSSEHRLCCWLELDNRPAPAAVGDQRPAPCQHPPAGHPTLLAGRLLLEDPEPPHADPGPPRVPAAGQVPHMGGDDHIHRYNTIVHSMCLLLSPSLQFKTRTKKLNVIIVLKKSIYAL